MSNLHPLFADICAAHGMAERQQSVTLMLSDMDAWDVFVEHNRDAIESEYGTVDRALIAACEGGLRLGGGASPIVDVFFDDGCTNA